MESVLYDDDVRSSRNTDTIRVPDQKVHNYRSDRWIALKLFPRVSGGCFTWRSVESVRHDDDVRSGRNTDTTTMSGRAVTPTRYQYRIKRSITIDPTVGSL